MANQKANPTQDQGDLELPAGYKPMSVGQRRLEVPDKPGWHRHWFRGTPGNLARAKQAGYRFVDRDEVSLNDFDLAGGECQDAEDTGIYGKYASAPSGDSTERLYLMECPEKLFQHAQSLHMQLVHETATALKGGMIGEGKQGETKEDTKQRYSEVSVKGRNLFTRKS